MMAIRNFEGASVPDAAELRIIGASYDARIEHMAGQIIDGKRGVVADNLQDAIAVAHDREIDLTEVDSACTIAVHRRIEELLQ